MIGERLLDLRKDFNMTQDKLGERLRINKHSISAYERDISEPPDSLKVEIAKFFGVSVDYLLGLTDDPSPHYRQVQSIQTLRLPPGLPDAAIQDLKEYLEYLTYKYEQRRR